MLPTNFFRDRVHVLGAVFVVIGAALLVASRQIQPDLIAHALAQSAATVMGYVLLFVGLAALRREQLTPRVLRFLDLVWMVMAAVTAVVGLTQASLVSSDDFRHQTEQNLSRARKQATSEIEVALSRMCSQNRVEDAERCRLLGIVWSELHEGEGPIQVTIAKICPKPVTPDYPLFAVCVPLNFIISAPNDPIVADNENVWRDKFFLLLVLNVVAMALGLRMVKSVAEFWWVKS